MEPRFHEPLFNEVLDITNEILRPGQSYSKMYGMKPRYNEPRYNEPRYNEFFDITNIIRKPKRKIYLDISIINYDLDITNFLVVSPRIRYIEVFDITNPPFNEQI